MTIQKRKQINYLPLIVGVMMFCLLMVVGLTCEYYNGTQQENVLLFLTSIFFGICAGGCIW